MDFQKNCSSSIGSFFFFLLMRFAVLWHRKKTEKGRNSSPKVKSFSLGNDQFQRLIIILIQQFWSTSSDLRGITLWKVLKCFPLYFPAAYVITDFRSNVPEIQLEATTSPSPPYAFKWPKREMIIRISNANFFFFFGASGSSSPPRKKNIRIPLSLQPTKRALKGAPQKAIYSLCVSLGRM